MGSQRIYLSSPHMSGNEQKYITEAFDTNWIAPLGPNVTNLEQEICEYVVCKEAAVLSSGTAAIHLALRLLGVGEGDLVFCSSLTFIASANPILYQGAQPVFIDSDEVTWNMCPVALKKAFEHYAEKNQLPKAVVVVNLYGQSADYDEIAKICDYYNVPIIEDAAESLGATYKGKKSGTFGKFGIFSFNGNKIITTSGGGVLISDDVEMIEKARFLATQARDKALHYQHTQYGYNYRMSNILAGVGRAQLQVLDDRVTSKRRVFQRYEEALGTVSGISFMPEASFGLHTRWLTTMLMDPKVIGITPYELIAKLEEHNIESRPVWKPLHLQPLFEGVPYFTAEEGISVSDTLFARGICLPSGTNMTEEQQDLVITLIKEYLTK